MVPLAAELAVTEASVDKASKQPAVPPTSSSGNPFGSQEAAAFFTTDVEPSKSPEASSFGSSFDFFGAADLFPAPKAPGATGEASAQDNFFTAATSGDIDVTETKDSFGVYPSHTPPLFDTTFDFNKPQNPPQQAQEFGVVEVKDHGSFFDQSGLF